MKKIITLLSLLTLILTINLTTINTNAKEVRNGSTNQMELVSETLSVVQDASNIVNSYSALTSCSSYSTSNYAAANMINYNLSTRTVSFENFNKDSYENRSNNSAVNTTSSLYYLKENNSESNEIEKIELNKLILISIKLYK